MDFKIIVSKKAQNEIENAIEYYSEINSKLALRFYNELVETYKKLELNPDYQIRHKNYRAIPLKVFPFFCSMFMMKRVKLLKFFLVFTPQKTQKNILNSFKNYEKKYTTYNVGKFQKRNSKFQKLET